MRPPPENGPRWLFMVGAPPLELVPADAQAEVGVLARVGAATTPFAPITTDQQGWVATPEEDSE